MERLRLGVNARTLTADRLRGWSRYTINLLEALLAYDVDYVLFTDTALADHFLERLPRDRFQVAIETSSRYFWWEQRTLPALCRRHRVDLLHCPINYGLPAFSPCPTVLTLHDAIAEKYYRPLSPWRERARPASLAWNLSAYVSRRSADRVITVSQHSKQDIVDFFRLPADKVSVIHEAADPLFDRLPTEEAVRHVTGRYGIPRPYLLYVGGWERRKNAHFLVRAFERAQTDITLVMAGGRPDEIAEMSRRYAQLDDRVRFIGWVEDEDLPALYAGARAFIYPSEYEGFGLQLCEAMKVGCPVLASNTTSLPEILGAGGETFPLGDDPELVRLIERVVADDEFYEDLRDRSQRKSADYSWAKTGAATWQVYEDLRRPSSRS